jgi:hypothetical protein
MRLGFFLHFATIFLDLNSPCDILIDRDSKEDDMKLAVTSQYGRNETYVLASSNGYITRRQYRSALRRLNAIGGDTLKLISNQDVDELIVLNNDKSRYCSVR